MPRPKSKQESLAQVVGRNLQRLREKHELTQDELAEKTQLHRVTIAQIEAARYASPRSSTLKRIAEAMGESLDSFFVKPEGSPPTASSS